MWVGEGVRASIGSMLDLRRTVLLGSAVFALACTPRPTANLVEHSTETPEVRGPEVPAPTKSARSSRWIDLSVKSEYGCAVERTGAVYCWGRGPAAEMELREIPAQPTKGPAMTTSAKWGPASRVEFIHDARRVSIASGRACAIVDEGRVRCWGAVQWGTQHVFDVPGISDAVELEVGENESCALLERGELWCWGASDFGMPQLRLDKVVSMDVSNNLACGLSSQGEVVCWGQAVEDYHRYDRQFQHQQKPAPTPQELAQMDFPDLFEVGRFRGAVGVALSNWNKLCVVRADGKVACSERDVFSILRKEDVGMRAVEGTEGVAKLASTRSHTCAQTTDGHVSCWGRNVYGQLGDGSSTTRQDAKGVVEIDGVVDLSVSEDFSCALTRDDQIACWGFDRGEAIAREELHVHTLEGLGASSLAAAGRSTCVIDDKQQLRCWGSDMLEQFGISIVSTPTPVNLSPRGELVAMNSGWQSCFLISDGTLSCGNWSGRPGSPPSFSVTQTLHEITAFAAGPPPLCTIAGSGKKAELSCGPSMEKIAVERQLGAPRALSAANMRGCVIHGRGKVSCFGELYHWGDKPPPPREFKRVPGISSAIAVSGANYHDCALLASGKVSCWVARTESEWAEDGRTVKAMHYRIQDITDIGLDDVVQIDSGTRHHCALDKAGEVRCWGDSPYNEGIEWKELPPLEEVVEIAIGNEHSCVRHKNGDVTCWGDDVWGQLGRIPSRVYLRPTTIAL